MTGMEPLAIMSLVATAGSMTLGFIGQMQQGQAQAQAGEAQYQAARYQAMLAEHQAKAMEQQAGQERAVSQRAAMEERRKGRLVTSRGRAVSAAAGTGALDPIIAGDIDYETEVRALTALYEGEERGRGLEYGAELQRAGGRGDIYAGEVARRAGRSAKSRSLWAAGGTILSGASSMYSKYKAYS